MFIKFQGLFNELTIDNVENMTSSSEFLDKIKSVFLNEPYEIIETDIPDCLLTTGYRRVPNRHFWTFISFPKEFKPYILDYYRTHKFDKLEIWVDLFKEDL